MDVFFLAGLVIATWMLFWFVIAQLFSDNSLVDIAWGLGFVAVAFVAFHAYAQPLPVQFLMLALVTIWGLRLAYHIGRRKLGAPEDWRYAQWRAEWLRRGRAYFLLRSLFQVFVLQGVLMFIIALPIMLVMRADTAPTGVMVAVTFAGLFVWITGLFFESVGDAQLARFKKSPKTRGKIITSGLWKYTRHPNYFGEATMWWGLGIIALAAAGSMGGWAWLGLLSPIVLTLLLLFVSGVPMLEQKYAGRKDWEEYKKRTSMFAPWFPKE